MDLWRLLCGIEKREGAGRDKRVEDRGGNILYNQFLDPPLMVAHGPKFITPPCIMLNDERLTFVDTVE